MQATSDDVLFMDYTRGSQGDFGRGYGLIAFDKLFSHAYGFSRVAVRDQFAISVFQSD
jgi:hypothetical protein